MALHTGLSPLMQDFRKLRNEGVVKVVVQAMIIGGGAGIVIGAFRWLYIWAGEGTAVLLDSINLESPMAAAVIFGVLVVLAIVLGLMVKYEPLISGSGIPHVELVLCGKSHMPWLRVLVCKFVGTLIALSSGLSVGREGPCVQMGAAVGCGCGQMWHGRSENLPRYLIGGSVAGLTAAFGAPLAGMVFAFEELKSIISAPLLLFTGAAALAAWAMVNCLLGLGLVFPFANIAALEWEQGWMLAVIGLAMGLLGAAYNSMLLFVTRCYDSQTVLPGPVKPVLPCIISGLLLYFFPQLLAGIGVSVESMANGGYALSFLEFLLLAKIAFSILSFSCGVPGGILMPMLTIGAIAGAVMGSIVLEFSLAASDQLPAFLVLCMAGLFAGTVRAPLTGSLLVIEMCGAYQCLLSAVIVAFAADFVANRLGSVPVYDSLRERMFASLNKNSSAADTPENNITDCREK